MKKTQNPMKGLLVYSFYASSKIITSVVLLFLVASIVILVLGEILPFSLVGDNSIYGSAIGFVLFLIPYVVMTMSGDTTNWERFQIAMPVSRKQLVASFYISVIISQIIAILVLAIITGLWLALQEGMLDAIIATGPISFAHGLGMPLFMAALLFPLAITKVGYNNQSTIFLVSMFASVIIFVAVGWIIGNIDLSTGGSMLLLFATGAIPFIVSFIITKRLYAQVDF